MNLGKFLNRFSPFFTIISIIVTIPSIWIPLYDFYNKNGLSKLFSQFVKSFSAFDIIVTYIIWIMFLTIYLTLILYENENGAKKQGEVYQTNHSFNLWKLAIIALAFQHATYILENKQRIIANEIPLYLAAVVIAVYGFYWLVLGRVNLNGYWDPDVLQYPDQNIIEKGVYLKTRHPIYTGQIYLSMAIFAISNNWWLILLPFGTFLLTFRRARVEEKALMEICPVKYEVYKRKVPSFIHTPLDWL